MAEAPLSIRAGDDVKKLFNELAEASSFENKGDFLKSLLTHYELGKVKEEISPMKSTIELVEVFSRRIMDSLHGTAVELITHREQEREAQKGALQSLQDQIDLLTQDNQAKQDEIDVLTAQYNESKQETEGLRKVLDAKEKEQSKLDTLIEMMTEAGNSASKTKKG
jgi:chromosome segregation ATPase